jgi:hypothetical protein
VWIVEKFRAGCNAVGVAAIIFGYFDIYRYFLPSISHHLRNLAWICTQLRTGLSMVQGFPVKTS